MNWLNKLERKFGRYAVHNLTTYLSGHTLSDMQSVCLYRYDDLAVSAAGSDSARTDLEDRILDSGTAAGQSSGNRHYADALLFSRYYAGEDLGSIPL